MKKVLFIYNPHAGKATIKTHLADIIETLATTGDEITVSPTRGHMDARNKARDNAGLYDLVVCSGGDGTLDEVVNGVMESGARVPVGYIPAGSTNDFANSLGIPKNMVEAAQVITKGQLFSCDIGQFNDNNFVYVAAFGTFAEVSYDTPQATKNALGHAAYVLEAIKRLSEIKTYRIRVECNGEVIFREFLLGMVTNTISVGGFKGITDPSTELNDGLFEVLLIAKPEDVFESNMLMLDVLNGTNDSGCLYKWQTTEINFASEEPMKWTLDGEFGGEVSQICIKALPKALDILVPEDK